MCLLYTFSCFYSPPFVYLIFVYFSLHYDIYYTTSVNILMSTYSLFFSFMYTLYIFFFSFRTSHIFYIRTYTLYNTYSLIYLLFRYINTFLKTSLINISIEVKIDLHISTRVNKSDQRVLPCISQPHYVICKPLCNVCSFPSNARKKKRKFSKVIIMPWATLSPLFSNTTWVEKPIVDKGHSKRSGVVVCVLLLYQYIPSQKKNPNILKNFVF